MSQAAEHKEIESARAEKVKTIHDLVDMYKSHKNFRVTFTSNDMEAPLVIDLEDNIEEASTTVETLEEKDLAENSVQEQKRVNNKNNIDSKRLVEKFKLGIKSVASFNKNSLHLGKELFEIEADLKKCETKENFEKIFSSLSCLEQKTTFIRAVNYFFKAKAAVALKTKFPKEYEKLLDEKFNLRNKNDRSALFNFYHYVIQEFPSAENASISELSQLYILHAPITWREWRPLVTKPKREYLLGCMKESTSNK